VRVIHRSSQITDRLLALRDGVKIFAHGCEIGPSRVTCKADARNRCSRHVLRMDRAMHPPAFRPSHYLSDWAELWHGGDLLQGDDDDPVKIS
jgi:hypothetical protein